MGNRKGVIIDIIYIDKNGFMKVITTGGEEMKVTRQERCVLANYKSSTYEDDIKHFFGNENILSDEFRVVAGDRYVYGKHVAI